MPSDTKAKDQAGADNQPEPVPSSDQKADDFAEVVEAAPVKEESETTESEDLSLPDDVSSRTAEQFDKLRERLREERLRRQEAEQLGQQYQTPAQGLYSTQEEAVTPLYDPQSGTVDINELEKIRLRATTASKRAEAAEKKFEKYVQQQQEREAYQAYPELNPKSKNHDEDLFKLTRAVMTDSMVNPKDYGGAELTAKQAAEFAKSMRDKTIRDAEQKGATKAVEQLTPKEQAGLEATGRSDRRTDVADRQNLAERTRRNDLGAIMERLKHIPSVASK